MGNENVSYFDKVKITSKGLALLHKLIVRGEPLRITRVVIGDGIPEQDPVTLTELVHEIPSRQTGESGTSAIVDLQMYLPENEQTILTRVRVQNGDTPFVWRECAFIANDPDEGEIKFAYTVDRTEHAMSFPAYDGVPISSTVDVAFYVSNSANFEANITLPAEVSYEEFMAHKKAAELDHPDKSVTYSKLSDDVKRLISMIVLPDKDYSGSGIYIVPGSHIDNMPTPYCIFVFARDTYEYGSGDSNVDFYTFDLATGKRYSTTKDSYFNISKISKSDWKECK